jgi:iron-sulfur cluster assembly protein
MNYVLGFDKKEDRLEIEWANGLNTRGFTFNPNASKTCGCGTSFAV